MNVWDRLTKPSAKIKLPEQRQQARLFSGMLVFFIPGVLISQLIVTNFDSRQGLILEPVFLITLLGNLLFWIAYGLSRTQYYREAIILFVILIAVLIFMAVKAEPQYPETFSWLLLPILLADLLLPLRFGIGFTCVIIFNILLFPLWSPPLTADVAVFSAVLIGSISPLLLLFANLRQRDLAHLQQEREYLALISDDLRKVQNELEQRIEERTHTLEQTNQTLREQMQVREQAEQLLAERNQEFSLINRILMAASSNLDVAQILTVACQEMAQVLATPCCTAALLDPDRLSVTIVAEYRAEDKQSFVGQKISLQESVIFSQIVQNAQSVIIFDTETDAMTGTRQESDQACETYTILALPLFILGEIVGVIGVSQKGHYPFSPQEIELGSNVAPVISQALYAAHLFSAEREQHTLAEALLDTAHLLGSTLNLSEMLDRVLIHVERVVPHDSANIMLVEMGICRVVRSRGYPVEQEIWINRQGFRIDALPTLSWMRDTHQYCWIPDTHISDLWHQVKDTEHIQAYIGAPMFVEQELIGFIHMDNFHPGSFTRQHAEHLQAFANQVALALHNARLHAQLAEYTDLLEQRVAERTAALARANEDLRALARVKDEFVANVSHELRTPITNLMLRQALLEKVPEKQEKHLDVMRRETQRLNRIIEDLLQLSRLDRGRVELNLVLLDLNALAMQYITDRSPLAESLGLTLTLGQRLDLPHILGDEELVGQVFSIILTNALNYTPRSGRVEIRTHLRPDKGEGLSWVGFSVADTGPGIPLVEQNRVLERFFRGRVAQESGVSGTGLGLSLAHQIVERHHGRLELSSSGIPGQGSMFTVWFPVPPKEQMEGEASYESLRNKS